MFWGKGPVTDVIIVQRTPYEGSHNITILCSDLIHHCSHLAYENKNGLASNRPCSLVATTRDDYIPYSIYHFHLPTQSSSVIHIHLLQSTTPNNVLHHGSPMYLQPSLQPYRPLTKDLHSSRNTIYRATICVRRQLDLSINSTNNNNNTITNLFMPSLHNRQAVQAHHKQRHRPRCPSSTHLNTR